MHDEFLVQELLRRWHDSKNRGQPLSVDELCSDHPELLPIIQQHIDGQTVLQAATEVIPPKDHTETLSHHQVADPNLTLDHESHAERERAERSSPPGYVLVEELGRGGMGVVYRATQVSLKRDVALKMILAGDHAGAAQLARFRAEAEAVAKLQHPGIVQIYEIGEHQGNPFYAMELVSGVDLKKKIRANPVTGIEAARLTEALARAMQHAHQRGVIHRDLKPANVLIGEDGIPKITDFGLAKRLEADSGQTQTGQVLGTPSYMAPEQAAGKTSEIGPAVDIYALGAILYDLITGRPPYSGDSVMTTLQRVLSEEVVAPSQLQPKVNRDLETICLKALHREPERRYSSALAMAQDLERFQAGEPILARREGLMRRTWRRVKRAQVAIAASLAVTLALVAAGYFFFGASQVRQVSALVHQFDVALNEKQWNVEHRSALEDLIAKVGQLDRSQTDSLEQRLNARAAEQFRAKLKDGRLLKSDIDFLKSELNWLAARSPETAGPLSRELDNRLRVWQKVIDLRAPFTERTVFEDFLVDVQDDMLVSKLPPGSRIGTNDPIVPTKIPAATHARFEAVIDGWQSVATTGLILNLAGTHRASIQAIRFTRDGKQLVTAGADRAVGVYDAATGKCLRRMSTGSQICPCVAISPDGKVVAAGLSNGDIMVWETASGNLLKKWRAHKNQLAALAFTPQGDRLVSSGRDKHLRSWILADFTLAATSPQQQEIINDLAFEDANNAGVKAKAKDKTGGTLIAFSTDRQASTWDAESLVPLKVIAPPAKGIGRGADRGACLGQDGKTLLFPRDNSVAIKTVDGSLERIDDLDMGIWESAVSRDGKYAAFIIDRQLLVWDLVQRKRKLLMTSLDTAARTLRFGAGRDEIAIGLSSGDVVFWDIAGNRPRWQVGRRDYAFLITLPVNNDKLKNAEAKKVSTLGDANLVEMQIQRSGDVLRSKQFRLGSGPLKLSAWREGDVLSFKVNDNAPLEFHDITPLPGNDETVFGVYWPQGVRITSMQAEALTLPSMPSELERGDELFNNGRFAEALALYQQQAVQSASAETVQEANCKTALCLEKLGRTEEADQEFERVAAKEGDRWPLVAASRLFLLRLEKDQLSRTDALLDMIKTRYPHIDLSLYVPDRVRQRVTSLQYLPGELYLFTNEKYVKLLEQRIRCCEVFGNEGNGFAIKHRLMRLHSILGNDEPALKMAEETLDFFYDQPGGWTAFVVRDCTWILRVTGKPKEALAAVDRIFYDTPGVIRKVPTNYSLFYPILVERARCNLTLGDWEQAEKDLLTFHKIASPHELTYSYYAVSMLIMGFIEEHKGDSNKAQQWWRKGLYSEWTKIFPEDRRPQLGDISTHPDGMLYDLILSSLTDSLSEQRAARCLDAMIKRYSGDTVQSRLIDLLQIPPDVLRKMWRSPRGRDYARKIAFRSTPPLDHYRAPPFLLLAEYIRQKAMPAKMSPDQEEIVWQTINRSFQAYLDKKIDSSIVFQVGLGWKGVTGYLGWGGASGRLPPDIRGPAAYVLGQRYLRLNKRSDATDMFRSALKDAGNDALLQRLAREELSRLDKAKPEKKAKTLKK